MGDQKSNKKGIFAGIFVGLICALLITSFYFFISSPRYMLLRLGWAITHHDSDTFLVLVDVDRIVDDQSELFLNLMVKEISPLPLPFLKIQIGAPTKDALKTLVKQKVREELMNSQKEFLPSSFALLTGAIKQKGNNALVTFKTDSNPLKIGLFKTENQGWRVVSIDPQDLKNLLIKSG